MEIETQNTSGESGGGKPHDSERGRMAEGCRSAISPCSHQQRDPTTICDHCGGRETASQAAQEEAQELAESERISAAQATYDEWMQDYDPHAPDHEVHLFDAMKAAIAAADTHGSARGSEMRHGYQPIRQGADRPNPPKSGSGVIPPGLAALAAPAAKGGTEDVRKLAAFLSSEIDGLISESDGVAGLHQNGDIATWEELLPGGKYERLTSLDDLRHALTVIVPPAGAAGGGSGDLGALSARSDIINREARRREILEFLQDKIGTAWTCNRCNYSTYHSSGYECADCGAEMPLINQIAFKLHASHTEDCDLEAEVKAEFDAEGAFLAPTPDLGAQGEPVAEPVEFDAGYLPNSGRDADQWHDAIRQLLASAHDHYVEQFRELAPVAQGEPVAKHHGAAVIAGLAELIPLIDDLGAVAMGFVQSEPTPDKAKLLMGAIDRLLHKRDTLDFDEAPAAPRSGSGVTAEGIAEAIEIIRTVKRTYSAGFCLSGELQERMSRFLKQQDSQAPRPCETGDGWEPIETAPKDGQLIAVAAGCAYWDVERRCWCSAVGHAHGRPISWSVTHWKSVNPITIPSQPHPAAQAGDGGGA